jgi:hypothetical protein
MGLRRTSSLNVIRLGSDLAPDGTAMFKVQYVRETPNGVPVESDPDAIRVEVRRPDGVQMVANYPAAEGDSDLVAITKLWTGNYGIQVYLGTLTGRWRMKVITNGGYGPAEEVEFQVTPAT